MQLEYFFMKCVKGRTFSEVIRKKHNLEVYANCIGLTVDRPRAVNELPTISASM